MAETSLTPPVAPAAGFPDAGKHNADVASKLLKQDLINTPPEVQPASDALDALAEQFNKEKEAKESGAPPAVEPPKEGMTEAEKAEAEAKAKADADAAAKKETEKEEWREQAEKIFKDSPTLPAGAAPKSSEAFAAIKEKAVQEISARETELEKLRTEIAKLGEQLKNPVPPELTKELEDHRAWRAKLDVESDPKFKEFDKTISASREFIYAQLQKHPVITPEVIAEIKKHGGPDHVVMQKLFDAIKDPTTQRLIESKIADIEMQKYSKEQVIKATKDNVQQYMADREKQAKENVGQHNTITKQFLDPMLKELKWFAKKELDAKADEPTRKSAEEHNKFVDETNQQLTAAYQDDSPQMRAILLVGMAQLFNLQKVHANTQTELAAAKKALEEVTAKWEKVKGASTSRLRESAAPSTGTPKIKPAETINTRPADALDALAKQVMEERQAKGV
jgi:hypothetical protein